jgi:hypothetical protein
MSLRKPSGIALSTLAALVLVSLSWACSHAPPVPPPPPPAVAPTPPPAPAPPLGFGEIPSPPVQPASGPLLASRFPSTLSGLPLVETIDYEAKGHAGLGYSISYGSRDSLFVTVYVYDMGLSGIPDGADAPQTQEQLRKAMGDIFQAERMGAYQNVAKVRDTTIVIGGPAAGKGIRAAGAVFNLEVRGESKTSHVYASGYRGSFVKLRCTYAHESATEAQSEEAMKRFFVALWPVLNS